MWLCIHWISYTHLKFNNSSWEWVNFEIIPLLVCDPIDFNENVLLIDIQILHQVLIASALIAAAAAAGPPAYGAPAYAPAPYKEEKLAPQPFAYQYGVVDDYSKNNFQKTETQDAEGKVAGSYTIALPDGRIQTTTYTADHYNGFVAEVTYEGTHVYPEEPKGGYGHAAPVYAPAPAYHA